MIKTHPTQPPGGRDTDYSDYPKEKTAYAMRNANYMIHLARQRGQDVGAFMARLLDGDFPWAKLRQAQKLVRLADKYGARTLDSACRRALGFELIKTHPTQPRGGRDTDYSDYPKEKTPYAMRNADYMIHLARRRGKDIGAFMTRLLDGNFPWAKLRQAQKLVRLVDKYGAQALDSACRRALGFELINVHRVEQIVLRGLDHDDDEAAPRGMVVQGSLRFLRQSDSFTQSATQEEDPDGDS